MITTGQRQTQHALTALARTTPGRRRLIAACAEEYLTQVERRAFPFGWDGPVADDPYSRANAYWNRRGRQFAQMLGISCQPSDRNLPATARAVIDAVTAPVRQLTAAAARSGNPAAVAVAYVVSGVAATTTAPSGDSTPVTNEDRRVIPVDEPLYGPAARAMRDALRETLPTTARTGDSDPDMDEMLRHIQPRKSAALEKVAEYFTEHRPADPMTEAARMTVALRTAGSAAAARPVLRVLPFPAGRMTRGEYGQRVLAQVGGAR